jgi:hypothetical protein
MWEIYSGTKWSKEVQQTSVKKAQTIEVSERNLQTAKSKRSKFSRTRRVISGTVPPNIKQRGTW